MYHRISIFACNMKHILNKMRKTSSEFCWKLLKFWSKHLRNIKRVKKKAKRVDFQRKISYFISCMHMMKGISKLRSRVLQNIIAEISAKKKNSRHNMKGFFRFPICLTQNPLKKIVFYVTNIFLENLSKKILLVLHKFQKNK